ncbi:ABC transporter ATP-binding protein [Actinomycetospora termitidis]|uniref:ATP-binding cassette domain-containing protein n=1 Tax=Actinomycetospora termitidis TaxID=3053470 RepID=A0ABT7MGR6_9PSEU|nr:ATP-binding cassette domain-containing protein [Actinomycetospora sp. Odt1-22]MDL5159880.1 ATP-binding cassette domain-containing protein [Actinomycetospora sp. Odt1-22]
MPGFALRGVVLRHGDATVLDGADAELPGEGVTVLWGPSGAGKTSTLRLLNRLDVPDGGSVAYDGTDLADLDPRALRRRVGMVFQRPTPFAGTVADNLAVASPDADRTTMQQALERVSLATDLLDRDADTLSGGELQRMCLARTLITAPETLLLDEPTSALDAEPAQEFERTVLDLVGGGLTVVWVGHDAEQVRRVADRVLELRDGGLVESREWELARRSSS